MILIFTAKQDGHIESVSRHLDAAGAAWVRINTEDFATNVELTLTPATGSGTLLVRDSGKRIDLRAVTSVWYRKPEPVVLAHFSLDPGALQYVDAEFSEILMGIYALLGHAIWINSPFTTRLAHRKLRQLQVATQAGFQVPRTLVTNDLAEVRRFADELQGDLAIKSLGSLNVTENSGEQTVQYGLFTRRISRAELEAVADKVGCMPTLYQQFIEKNRELRITCVGRQVFSCSIEAREGDITSDDHRFDTKRLKHTAYPCPEMHNKLHRYMAAFGLNFACFDILIAKTGEAIFCECNANGQWLWCEEMAGLPIGKAIAELLMGSGAVNGQSCNSGVAADRDHHWPYSREGRLHAEIKSLRSELSRAEHRAEECAMQHENERSRLVRGAAKSWRPGL
ncbi:MAG TPA: hypothetical protein VHE81_17395 [Lacipirellulaceae bacterium]|nr:hypothetical protein [Lacipirellulaceae bacterium]